MQTLADAAQSTTNNCPTSSTVVTKIADATETSVEDLPPLFDVIDPDALDRLVASLASEGRVEFRYFGHVVTVHADETIEITPDN